MPRNVYCYKLFIYKDLYLSATEVFMRIHVEDDLSFAIFTSKVYNKYVQVQNKSLPRGGR